MGAEGFVPLGQLTGFLPEQGWAPGWLRLGVVQRVLGAGPQATSAEPAGAAPSWTGRRGPSTCQWN